MRTTVMLLAVIGLVLGAATIASAQARRAPPEGPGAERDGPRGAGMGRMPEEWREKFEKMDPEKRQALMERIRKMEPEQRRQALERLFSDRRPEGDGQARRRRGPANRPDDRARGESRSRGEHRGNRPDDRARNRGPDRDGANRGPGRQAREGAVKLREFLQNMPADRRQHLVQRLKNASPEDRRRFLERMGNGQNGQSANRRRPMNRNMERGRHAMADRGRMGQQGRMQRRAPMGRYGGQRGRMEQRGPMGRRGMMAQMDRHGQRGRYGEMDRRGRGSRHGRMDRQGQRGRHGQIGRHGQQGRRGGAVQRFCENCQREMAGRQGRDGGRGGRMDRRPMRRGGMRDWRGGHGDRPGHQRGPWGPGPRL